MWKLVQLNLDSGEAPKVVKDFESQEEALDYCQARGFDLNSSEGFSDYILEWQTKKP